MNKVISIDPGPHTGWVIWLPEKDEYHFGTFDFTIGEEGPHRALWGLLVRNVHEGDTIICEKFEYQKEKAKFREHLNYDAAEYVGVVKLYGQLYEESIARLVMQSPSQAVGDACFWTNDKLAKLGLKRSIRHENDALRHLLYYRTFTLKDQTLLHKLK